MDPLSTAVLATVAIPKYNAEFYFGLFAFSCSVALGVFYLIDWYLHHKGSKNFILLWAVGVFLSVWFQLPFLAANAGLPVVVSDFHAFFSIMLPIAFFGLLLLYRGVRLLSGSDGRELDVGLAIWFVFCGAYFSFFFFRLGSVNSYAPIIFGAAFFFLTLLSATLLELIKWYNRLDLHLFPRTGIGIALFSVTVLLSVAAWTMALLSIFRFSPQLWFVAIMASPAPYVLQSIGVITFTCSIYFVHKEQAAHAIVRELDFIREGMAI